MQVGVRHCLTRGEPVIETDVESVRIARCQKPSPHLTDKFPDGILFRRGEFINRSDVLSRHDERVAFSDRECVRESDGVFGLDPQTVSSDCAEGARIQSIRIRWKQVL